MRASLPRTEGVQEQRQLAEMVANMAAVAGAWQNGILQRFLEKVELMAETVRKKELLRKQEQM